MTKVYDYTIKGVWDYNDSFILERDLKGKFLSIHDMEITKLNEYGEQLSATFGIHVYGDNDKKNITRKELLIGMIESLGHIPEEVEATSIKILKCKSDKKATKIMENQKHLTKIFMISNDTDLVFDTNMGKVRIKDVDSKEVKPR